jgi:isoquinoline 1-oxidoreductase beta subunit
MNGIPKIDRRQFIVTSFTIGGGFALALAFPNNDAEAASVDSQIGAKPWEALSDKAASEINPWLVIAPDDTVTIRIAQSEMGQATFTSFSKMIVEELECDWSKVRAEYASVNRHIRENGVYGRMATNSSSSVRLSRQYLQQAGASARERLMAAAAEQWGVPRSELIVKAGVITHTPSGRTLRYGQVAQKAAAIRLSREPLIKTPDQFTFMNKPTRLLETPVKVDGTATYGLDVRIPGMLYAAAKQSPVFLGKVKKFDADAIKGRPGVHSVVKFGGRRIEEGVAVIADSYWHAKSALDALPIEWDEGDYATASTAGFSDSARKALDEPGAKIVTKKGDPESIIKSSGKVVEAVYEVPYLDHAMMEPMNCTAHVTADRVEVWVGTQNPEDAVNQISSVTGIPVENVYLHNCFMGGGFGRRGGNDDVRMAVDIARQIGQPVKVIWSREETTQHGEYRPMRVSRFRAVLGDNGMPVACHTRVVGAERVDATLDEQTIRGLHDLPYRVTHELFDYHLRQTHVPNGPWTSVGRSQNEFFLETFIDELAHAAGKDPYEYRRSLIKSTPDFPQAETWLKVLSTVAEKSKWGTKLPAGTARGIAIGDSRRLTRNDITTCAVVATVSVTKQGKVKAERFDVAMDTGPFLVNPLAAERQVEMQVVMGLAAGLKQQITIEKGRVKQSNFTDFPLLTRREMPEIAIHFVKASDYPIAGVGEEILGWVAPAFCNAIFAATGKRVRSLPLSNHDLSWA